NGTPKPPRPEQTPDYVAVFQRAGSSNRPPLVSVATALRDNNAGVRRAALEAALTMRLDRPIVVSLLVEALKDSGLRYEAVDALSLLEPKTTTAVSALLAELRMTR